MAKYRWSVRIGSEEGEELATDYESSQPFGEPDVGDVFSLPDGSGPWRVEDIRKRGQGATNTERSGLQTAWFRTWRYQPDSTAHSLANQLF